MRSIRLCALVLVVPIAAACADTGDQESEMETADTATADATETTATGTFQVRSMNDSGITGEVESESRGDSLFLNVTLEGTEATDFAAHVHSGSCQETGAPVAAQVNLQWGSAGMDEPATESAGQASGVRVGVARADLGDSQADYSLRFHGTGGEVVACADLPGELTATGAGAVEGGPGGDGS